MQCPFCKEEILEGAIKCKHCGSMINGQKQPAGSWAMEKWQAVIIAIILFAIMMLANGYITMALFLLSSIWASFDAGKLDAKKFKSKLMKASPGMVFIGCLLLWIVVFPWYLYFRSQIKAGLVELNNGSAVPSFSDVDPANDSLNR